MQAHIVVKTVLINHILGKSLLIRRSPDDFGNWEGPGGAVEENETLEEAIMREVLEETGLVVTPERILYASLDEIHRTKIVFLVYLCSTTEENVRLSGEHVEYRWVDKTECEAMLQGGIAKDFKKYGVYELKW
ncbi:MAG: NUDIX domain-containing protein [Lachnospiraceae bacterium]|nr:NUDIX domain-containing protein [Lachnospiraceae bacterium]